MSRLDESAAKFSRTVIRYARCCERVEREFERGRKLRIIDVELLYSSCFASVFSQWEVFLEDVLLETVCGTKSRKRGNARYVVFQSKERFRGVILPEGVSYLSMATVEKAEALASRFVQEGRPISRVSPQNRTYIGHAVLIRNAIAHDSGAAKKKFKEKVPGVRALPSGKQQPGSFLRHMFRVGPNQRRYEIYFGAYRAAAGEIAAAW